jgi:hypothetical protein
VRGAEQTLNLVENPPGFNSFNLNHPAPSPHSLTPATPSLSRCLYQNSLFLGPLLPRLATVPVSASG